MPAIEDIIKDKTNLFNDAEDAFFERIKKLEGGIWRRIKRFLNRLTTKKGRITDDDDNRSLLLELDKAVMEAFREAPLKDRVDKFIFNFDEADRLNRQYYGKIFTASERRRLNATFRRANRIKANIIDDLTLRLTNTQLIRANLVNPIRDILFQGIYFNQSIADLEENLRKEILTSDKNSRILSYTKQIATDALNGYDGATNDLIRDEYELNGWRYLNTLIKTSRQNCIELVTSTGAFSKFAVKRGLYRVKDIPAIIAIARNRPGWNPLSTPETFAQYSGGWNCRHLVSYERLSDKEMDIVEEKLK